MHTDKPLVSIGMPVYNGENYIAEAIDSILAQTFENFELVISDNDSTDKTRKIYEDYAAKDKRIRHHRNEKNVGAARNYNRVVELSSGKYFKWAAHDDLVAPEFLERCVNVLESNPAIVLCYPGTNLINEQGETEGHYIDDLHLNSSKPSQRFRQFFDTQGLCHAVFGLIRTNTLKKTALIGNYAMSDRVLLGELALHGQFHELPDYLFYRRIHPQISTHANITDNEIATWFDPQKRGKLVFPKWRRLLEYSKAVKHAPLSWYEQILCYLQIGRFALSPEKWGGIIRDLAKV